MADESQDFQDVVREISYELCGGCGGKFIN